MRITGTNHFRSVAAAQRYYRQQWAATSKDDIYEKIKSGEIRLGVPELQEGQRLGTTDDGARYTIIEDEPVHPDVVERLMFFAERMEDEGHVSAARWMRIAAGDITMLRGDLTLAQKQLRERS